MLDVALVGCIVHVRQAFADSLSALPEGESSVVFAQGELNSCNHRLMVEQKKLTYPRTNATTTASEQSFLTLDTFLAWSKRYAP